MSASIHDELASLLPPGAVSDDPDALRDGASDWWTLSMLRRARGVEPELPAAVAFPTSTEEVAAVLSWASSTGTPVIPRGAGSGVCGAIQPAAGWIVVDMSRMDRILHLDTGSGAVHVQAGIRGDRLESALAAEGLTAGHYPQSLAISSVGGWIAASGAGQASSGYGAIEDRLLGLTAVFAGGEVVRLRPVPRSAAGPDLRRLVIGSEGTLCVVTEAWLACAPVPTEWAWECVRLETFEQCMAALRDVERAGCHPLVMRAYDQVDATLNFGRLGHEEGSLAILGFDAGSPGLADRMAAARDAFAGGEVLGPAYGEHWWEHRNAAVDTYLRIMGPDRMFGRGVVVDTMEIAGLWSALPSLYRTVRQALSRHAEAVGCHLSHVYPAGSSLYFTFLVRAADDRDVEGRYLEAWDDAAAACLDGGGTISHHHGIGRLKARYLEGELGPEGVRILSLIKAALDPAGVLNPGSLIPRGPER